MTKVIVNGHEFDAEAIANLMDDDLREDLHAKGFGDEQAFVAAYCTAHLEKFGEPFVIN